MRIDVIDTIEAFRGLRQNWDAVYEADPEAQAFLSWGWIGAYLDKVNRPWFILAAKPAPTADYVAFFPLRLRTKVGPDGIFYNEIMMAGNMAADYTGFLCRPEFQDEAIPALARHLNKSSWATLHLENVRFSAERQRLFLQFFSQEQFRFRDVPRVNKRDQTNNRICPVVDLPADWESYLATLSSNTRQKIRRFLKRVDTSGEFKVTQADDRTFARDLDLLLRFWDTKWRPRKGTRTDHLLRYNRAMLTAAFERGALSLPVLWYGNVPVAALALFRDTTKRSLLFYMAGRDETFSSPPPGFVLHAHCIRKAIEEGFKTYDFLRGNEPYKYLFGATEHHITCLVVSTKDKRNLGGRLDPRSLPIVLARTSKRHQAGYLSEAQSGYRQILHTDARHAGALYGLGQVFALQGEHRAARKAFKALVGIKPESWEAWFRLAECYRADDRFSDAAHAYRRVIERKPVFSVAHYNLGCALCGLRDFRGAAVAFATALRQKPDFPEAEAALANALERSLTSPAGGSRGNIPAQSSARQLIQLPPMQEPAPQTAIRVSPRAGAPTAVGARSDATQS